ncbi:MAG: VOC family protein [Solirubrobacteraceae bacterium]|jgi:catechol 2,3-dioxygenase-like lactoylglutathione lyase family enzyme
MIEGVRLLRTALAVKDLDRSAAFYRHIGFEERARTQVGDAAVIAVLGLAGEPNRLQLTQPLGSTPPPAGGSYLVVEVPDLDAARHELARSSIEPVLLPPPDTEHGTRTAVFRDPDGHGVELMQRTRAGGRVGAA